MSSRISKRAPPAAPASKETMTPYMDSSQIQQINQTSQNLDLSPMISGTSFPLSSRLPIVENFNTQPESDGEGSSMSDH